MRVQTNRVVMMSTAAYGMLRGSCDNTKKCGIDRELRQLLLTVMRRCKTSWEAGRELGERAYIAV